MIILVAKPFNLLSINWTHIWKEHHGFQASQVQATLCPLCFYRRVNLTDDIQQLMAGKDLICICTVSLKSFLKSETLLCQLLMGHLGFRLSFEDIEQAT